MIIENNNISAAKWRTKIRKCNKTIFVNTWIESIPRLGIGSFTLVVCQGALNHLKDPQEGLNILKFSQVEFGRGVVTLNGKLGRTGVNLTKDLLNLFQVGDQHARRRTGPEIDDAKLVIKGLSPNLWINSLRIDDLGFHDSLLHKRHESFSIKALDKLIRYTNFNLIDFTNPQTRIYMSLEFIIQDNLMYVALSKTNILNQRSIAELIGGALAEYSFFASTDEASEASLNDPENGVFLYGLPTGFRATIKASKNILTVRNRNYVHVKLARMKHNHNSKTETAKGNNDAVTRLIFPLTDFTADILFSMTKRHIRLKGLQKLIRKFSTKEKSNRTRIDLQRSLGNLFSYLKKSGLFFIKNKKDAGDCFPKTCFHRFSCIDYHGCANECRYKAGTFINLPNRKFLSSSN